MHRIHRALEWSRSHEGKKLIRFTSVSLISTGVSQLFIILLYGSKLMGVIEATLVANLVATLPAYNLNRRWTWGKHGRSHVVKEIVPFWTMSALGIAFSFFMSIFAKHFVKTHSFPHWANTLIVMLANFIAFGIFWVLKLLVFNRIFHVNEKEEIEEHLEHEEEEEASATTAVKPGEISPGS